METLTKMKRIGMMTMALLGLVLSMVLTGCTDRNEAFIQGTWIYAEPSVGGITPQSSVHTNWSFDRGRVEAHSCCDFRPGMTGRYRIVRSEDDQLSLELYDLEGAIDRDALEIDLILNRTRESLTIQGTGPFLREDS